MKAALLTALRLRSLDGRLKLVEGKSIERR